MPPPKRIRRSKYFVGAVTNSEINNQNDEEIETSKDVEQLLNPIKNKSDVKKRKAKISSNNDSGRKKRHHLGKGIDSSEISNTKNDSGKDINDDEDDGDVDDWEEVEEAKFFDPDEYHPDIPDNIQISLDGSSLSNNKSRQKTDPVEAAIRQRINRLKKENQLIMHQCSLLLSIYRLQYLNSIINQPLTKAFALSILDLAPKLDKSEESLRKFATEVARWLKQIVNFSKIDFTSDFDVNQEMIKSLEISKIKNPVIFCLMFASFMRSMNLMTRLCYSLIPIPIKPNDSLCGIRKSLKLKEKAHISSHLGEDLWIEIFNDKNDNWFSFDPIDCSSRSQTSKTITYVLCIDNENHINDVTAKYARDWISCDMKKRRIYCDNRVADEWWQGTLDLFKNHQCSKYENADKIEIDRLISRTELPKRYSDYKNHPLFALTRDLLKYQSIYPPDAPPLGFFHDEPVYSRDCVQTLKSRETWLRDARTVKLNEKAYKIVQSRFKYKKNAKPGMEAEKETLELFGKWQTCSYEPPEAKNGKVPRNAYGNVDLYKSSMLPIGTVHLRLPGLLRTANKLNIDCVPAIVGFEGICGGAHPVMDGFVVCIEHKDILVDAWNQEQRIQNEKDEEKRQKRVLDNWKRLIRGLVIRRNLKIKYDFN